MNSTRRIALVAGVLFILTFVTSIAGALLYTPALSDAGYITGAGADTRVLLGALFELGLVITNIGTAVVLFPILRHQDEGLALGYVTARVVECTFIVIGMVSVVSIVTLRQQAAGADSGSLLAVGRALVVVHDWTFLLGPGFVVGIGNGLILGWLMYRSGLMPQRLALIGVVGGPLLAASGIAVLLGIIGKGSAWQGVATIPEIIWEASIGLVLTFKGFSPSPITGDGGG